MRKGVVGIEPSVLRWARESQGYTVEDVARLLEQQPQKVSDWENGRSSPTYVQLEDLAYKVFKRPLAVFFFPEPPPEETPPKKKFRTLPDYDLESLSADTLYRLRFARSLQLSLEELHEGTNPATKKIFRDVTLSASKTSVKKPAARVREYMGVSLATQASWTNAEEALKSWRRAVEEVGVYVFKHAFKEKSISGFCLLDSEFPLIYLNNSTTKTRQIFSMFHELGHLLLRVDGISKFDDEYIASLPKKARTVEMFCNRFAAEVLIPERDFTEQLRGAHQIEDETIDSLADRYNVSREAILRRLLDKNLISQELYNEKAETWANRQSKTSGGGNYYATKVSYLGERYLQLVFRRHYEGKITTDQVADYLGVKVDHVPEFENRLLRMQVVS